MKIIVVGGGAAGFFGAIAAAQANPSAKITILERGKDVLQKVKISGGGRCNVTHAVFLNRELAKNYPRGERELMSPFSRFSTGDTIDWFDQRGVSLKIEPDGRMFPTSNKSQTIIDCFLKEVENLKIDVKTSCRVDNLTWNEAQNQFDVQIAENNQPQILAADRVLIAAGSSHGVWKIVGDLGHRLIAPVPSLFTFNITDTRIADLAGVSVPRARLRIRDAKLETEGPVLVTHWGLSGPAVLRLSAWGARVLNDRKHQFDLLVNWTADYKTHEIVDFLQEIKVELAKKATAATPQYQIPSRLWQQFCRASGIGLELRWADLNKNQLHALAAQLGESVWKVTGKSTFKDEFVTAGGVDLRDINFKNMESKILKNLFFAGEILDIDAITGGFNFQAAWSTSWIAGNAMAIEVE